MVEGSAQHTLEHTVDASAFDLTVEALDAIGENALDAVISIDVDGVIIRWNAAAEATFGWKREEAVGRTLSHLIIPAQHREAHQRGLERYVRTRQGRVLHQRLELSALRRDGGELDVELSIVPLRVKDRLMFMGFVRDISDRKRAEAALRASEERFRMMADHAPVLIWVAGRDKGCTWFNRRWLEFVGRTMEQELGAGWTANVHPDDFAACSNTYGAAFQAREPFSMEYRLRRNDGVWRWILAHGVPSYDAGEFSGYVGSCVDVSDRRSATAAAAETEARYRSLAEALPHLVWTCLPDGWCDYLSRQWVAYTGRPESEQIGYGWADQLHPEDRARAQAAWAEATARGDRYDIEFRIRRADGAYRWFKTRALPLRDADGRIVKWFGSNTDFDDHKRAEARLEAQLERLSLLDRITRAIGERQDLHSIFDVVLRSLEDNMPLDFGCVCQYDAQRHVLTLSALRARSPELARAVGWSAYSDVAIDRNGLSKCLAGQLVYEPDACGVPFPFAQRLARAGLSSLVLAPLQVESHVFGVLIAARSQAQGFASADCEFLRQLSEQVGLAAHQARLYGALQRAYDDLRQSQKAAMQHERLRALGQIASGIAHNINNAISPVTLYTESLLESEPNLSPRARDYLETIQRAVGDVALTVAGMREFYRQREPQLELSPVDLNETVQQALDLTRARWSDMQQQRGVVIRTLALLDPARPWILGIASEIREALINLVFNAVDAMPEGGLLTLQTAIVGAPSEAGSGQEVQLEVIDEGTGMDEDLRQRCLEPFVTTKGERGTGLGLALVYGVVQRHNATIEVESSIGAGTRVRLRFPSPSKATVSPARPSETTPKLRLRVLVIDDDPLLIKSMHDILSSDGHRVVTADTGPSGIATFCAAQADDPFALVITDLGMPYIDGSKVAAAIKAAAASTPVILLTGWGQRLIESDDVPPHVDEVLSKPPKLNELRAAIARLCVAHGGST